MPPAHVGKPCPAPGSLRYTVKRLIGYQTSGKEKAPPLRVSFIIHGKQMKLVQWEQSIINERRWEGSKEREGWGGAYLARCTASLHVSADHRSGDAHLHAKQALG